MVYIGIDVGKRGAIAVIHGKNGLSVYPTPVDGNGDYDIRAICGLLVGIVVAGTSDTFCVIERAQAMPGQGVVSMFEFGKGFGIWLALLTSFNIPFQIVHSRVWTKELLAGIPGEKKERNIAAAKNLFPEWSPRLKKELDYCDAMLLAEYARRKR